MNDPAALLAEYEALRRKIDAKVAEVTARRQDDLNCKKGCSDCCAPGLTVLPVEAYAIEEHLSGGVVLPAPREDRCTFLDEEGACAIYAARPLLCRTHGLPIHMPSGGGRGQLPVLQGQGDGDHDDVWACALNFTRRAPAKDDVVNGNTLMALLFTVDARFRERAGLERGEDRVPLDDIADAWRGAVS